MKRRGFLAGLVGLFAAPLVASPSPRHPWEDELPKTWQLDAAHKITVRRVQPCLFGAAFVAAIDANDGSAGIAVFGESPTWAAVRALNFFDRNGRQVQTILR